MAASIDRHCVWSRREPVVPPFLARQRNPTGPEPSRTIAWKEAAFRVLWPLAFVAALAVVGVALLMMFAAD